MPQATGGVISVIHDVVGTLTVSITRTDAASLTVYASDLTTPITQPSAITASTDYYVIPDTSYTISVKLDGREVAKNDGTTRVVSLRSGQQITFKPGVVPSTHAAAPGAWVSYTPTLAGTGWVKHSTGTVAGSYCQIGSLVHFKASFVFGSGSTAGSASPTLTLPVTAAAGYLGTNIRCRIYDVSATTYYSGSGFLASTTTAQADHVGTAGVHVATDSTHPITFATGDIVYLSGTYEAA